MHSCLRLYLLSGLIGQIAAEFLVDDECSDGECALSVLQVQQRQLSAEDPEQVKTEEVKTEEAKTEEVKTEEAKTEEVKTEVKPVEDTTNTVSSCSNDTVCGSNRTCVFKEDRTWSQCVPLDDKTFQKECKYWNRKMRLAAVKATKILCSSVKCEWDQDCEMERICVSKRDGSWAQCVPLAKEDFQQQCVRWEDDFRLAAIRATHFNCPNTRCYSQDWCVRGARCALQTDGDWGQCIMCHEKSFQTNCYSWRKSFIPAAQIACHRKCLFDDAFEDGSGEKDLRGAAEPGAETSSLEIPALKDP